MAVTLALTNEAGKSYLILLQSSPDEHAALQQSVFDPVLQSITPLSAEPTAETPYTSQDVSFPSGDVSMAGTLTLPPGDGPFPALVLVTGSGPQDRDESLAPVAEIKPFRDIADYLSRNGIAVLRYDDRGVGQSGGDYATATLADFVADASAAVDFLASRDDIGKIGLAGHSEGGIVVPQVANKNPHVDFVIGLAAPAVNMKDVMIQQNRRLFGLSASQDQVDAVAAAASDAFDAVMSGDDTALRDKVAALIQAQTGQAATQQLIDVGVAQFQALKALGYFDIDVPGIWAQVKQPILAIYGTLDVQVDSQQNAPAMQADTADNRDVSVVVIDNMNHLMQEAKTGGVTEYATLDQHVMPKVLETLSSWLQAHLS